MRRELCLSMPLCLSVPHTDVHILNTRADPYVPISGLKYGNVPSSYFSIVEFIKTDAQFPVILLCFNILLKEVYSTSSNYASVASMTVYDCRNDYDSMTVEMIICIRHINMKRERRISV